MNSNLPERRKRGRPSLAETLAVLDEHVGLLHSNLGGLPRAVEADQVLRAIWLDDVHNSTAIEGNTMTRAQVEDLVENRRASGALVENLEIEGYARAADWVYRESANHKGVPAAVVREIHTHVVSLAWAIDPPVTREAPGAWRKGGVKIRSVVVPPPSAVGAELDAWAASTASRGKLHPVIHAAAHHASFERIHPFVDGNGRVGRLVLNFMLLQASYPPAVILAEHRPRYLQALKTADDGNPNPLAELIARSVQATLNRFLIPKLAGDAKLVPLTALAGTNGSYSATYLRDLVLDGRLRAVRDGRLWLSSRAWLKDYTDSRSRQGRQPARAPRGTKRRRRAPK